MKKSMSSIKSSTSQTNLAFIRRINADLPRHTTVQHKVNIVRKHAYANGIKMWKAYDTALDLYIKEFIK